jgi:hypothetical protein
MDFGYQTHHREGQIRLVDCISGRGNQLLDEHGTINESH